MTRFSAYLHFIGALIATNLKACAARRGNFALQAGLMFVNNLSFFVFWWVLFSRVKTLRGWDVHGVLMLYGLSAASYGLVQVFVGGVRHISRWVDEGELDALLVQPKATWLYAVGSRSQPSGVGDVVSGALFLGVSGHVRLDNLAAAIVCLLCGACVFLGAGLVFYSLAFWLRRTETLSRQLMDFLILFSLYPEALFGGMLRFLLFSALPAGFICYVPAHVLRDGSLGELPLLIAAAAGFLVLGIWVFERGLRRYASGSRFGVWG